MVDPEDLQHHTVTLGPWDRKEQADAYSDSLTDSRIGEQLLKKLGVEELLVFESA
jgi:hypothetical protein